MLNLFGDDTTKTPEQIFTEAPALPCTATILLAFSGGNDSRCLAHVTKKLFTNSPFRIELAAIDTQLGMDGWRESVLDFAKWIDLPVTFWGGEGRKFYSEWVEKNGWPGNVHHSIVQNRLKGRAYDKMYKAGRTATPAVMRRDGVAVWILSGIRKYESQKRQRLVSPYSWREGALFINPLFYWHNEDVIDYMIANDVPFSPFTQGDCKCGATVKNPTQELADMQKNAPELSGFLESLRPNCAWKWGQFDRGAFDAAKAKAAGQGDLWQDDGSVSNFPSCINCTAALFEKEESVMEAWQ